MNVNDIVQEQIDEARRKTAARKRAREELAEARQRGLQARHTAKLQRTPFPSLYEYALAQGCATCKAKPGILCVAPRKAAAAVPTDPITRLHSARQKAGMRHKELDVGRAPWPDQRQPGRRYDTLRPVQG
ncbi:hypothetical protein ACFWUZ_20540 [Streptomyces sp. NPDC058646]|uniref:hypothetical protein n=1 Tax=Streptomyces sp. NPDC058646 TaxID=3346574 RepID=UPI003649FEEE